eukprot:scaffold54520_cov36-Tisochrysis_lutea.AAC.2
MEQHIVNNNAKCVQRMDKVGGSPVVKSTSVCVWVHASPASTLEAYACRMQSLSKCRQTRGKRLLPTNRVTNTS